MLTTLTPETLLPIVAPLAGLLVLYYLHRQGRRWPDLWRLRRAVLPLLERVDEQLLARLDVDHDPLLSFRAHEDAEVGVVTREPWEVRRMLRGRPDCWARNLAACKYTVRNGERIHEVGSYALLSNGFFSREQTHIRLYPHRHGTLVTAHRELSPWRYPLRHYLSDEYDVEAGVERARAVFEAADA